MPTDHHLDPDEDALVQLGYETEDVEYKKLGKSVIWFFMFVTFCGVAGVVIFGMMIGWDNLLHPTADTAPFANRLPKSPNPVLQTNVTVRTDIKDLRIVEAELLQGNPSWADKGKGIVRLPIDKAMDLYLNRVAPNSPKETTITSGAPPVGPAPEHEEGGH
jgi:hypothetical protein